MSIEDFVAEYSDIKDDDVVKPVVAADADDPEITPDSDPAPELSPVEQKALAQGWKPQDEFQGDVEDWVDAKEFLFRGQLMERIQTQSKKLNSNKSTIEKLTVAIKKLGEHNQKLAEIEFDKALKTLKREKIQALKEEDHSTAVDIDEKIADMKQAKQDMKEDDLDLDFEEDTPSQPEVDPYYEQWVARPENKWYTENDVLRGAADAIAEKFILANLDENGVPTVSMREIITHAEHTLREKAPQMFDSGPKPRQSVSEPRQAGKTPPAGKKITARDVDEKTLAVARTFVQTKAFPSVQAYLDQLVETGDL